MNSFKNLLDVYHFDDENILKQKLLENIEEKVERYFTFSIICVDSNKRYLSCERELEEFCKSGNLVDSSFKMSDYIKHVQKNDTWWDLGMWFVDPEIFFHQILLDSDIITVDDSFKIKKISRQEKCLNKIFTSSSIAEVVPSIIKRKFYRDTFGHKYVKKSYEIFKKTKDLGKILDDIRVNLPINKD